MKKVYGIIAAVLLALAIIPASFQSQLAQQNAYAQAAGAIGGVEQRIKVNFADGSPSLYWSVYKEIIPSGQVLGVNGLSSGKVISSYQFETLVVFYSGQWTVTDSSISTKIQVQLPDGTYKTITPTSGGKTIERFNNQCCNAWIVYKSLVMATDLEAALGQHSSDIQYELRSTSTVGSVVARNDASTGGASGSWPVTPQTAIFTFKTSGISGGGGGDGGCVGTACDTKPTGKIYSVIVLGLVGGGFKTMYTTQLGAIKLADLAIPGEGTPFTSIKYELRMHLDNDNFNMPLKASFGDTTSTHNYNAYVNGQSVNPHAYDSIEKIGDTGDYRIIQMTITEADAIPKLTKGDSDGTYRQYSGNVEFTLPAGYVPLRGNNGATYKVQLPARDVTYNVIGLVKETTDGGGGGDCEFAGQTTTCNPAANVFDMSLMIYPLLGLGIAGFGYAVIRSRKQT